MSFAIKPVDITQETINSFVQNFGLEGGEKQLAEELVLLNQDEADAAFEPEIAAKIKDAENFPNYFTYEGLRTGEAGIFEDLGLKDQSPLERAFTDTDIVTTFSTADSPDLLRVFFEEAGKAAAATTVGVKTAGRVGASLLPPAIATGNPLLIGGAGLATGGSFLLSSGLAYSAGDIIADNLLEEMAPIPPSMKQAVAFYETAGAMSGGAGAPWLLPTKALDLGAVTFLRNLTEGQKPPALMRLFAGIEEAVPSMGRGARRFPKTTAFTEGVLTPVVTGGAGAFAEGLAPGNEAIRIGAEFIASNALPLTFLRSLPDVASSASQKGKAFFGADKKKEQLFERVNEIYDKYASPEQYDKMISELTSDEITRQFAEAFPGIELTAAQKSQDDILRTIEAARASRSEDLDATRKQNFDKAREFTLKFIRALQEEGTPDSIRAAAQLRSSFFDDLLSARLNQNLDRLARANARVRFRGTDMEGEAGTESIQDLSEKLAELVRADLGLARKHEADLWDAVPDVTYFSQGDDLPGYIDMWKNGLGFRKKASRNFFQGRYGEINAIVDEHFGNLGLRRVPDPNNPGEFIVDDSDIAPVTLKDLVELRTKVLQATRNAASGEAPDKTDVAKLSEFSQALLEEIKEMDPTSGKASQTLTTARQFSDALNDVFTRSVLGKVSRQRRTGEDFQIPEMLLQQMQIGRNADLTQVRVAQLQNFSEFMEQIPAGDLERLRREFPEFDAGVENLPTHVDGIIESYLRKIKPAIGREVLDPRTGDEITRVDARKLAEWRRDNAEILELFPQLDIDLANAESADRLYRIFEFRRKKTIAKRNKQATIQDLANLEVSPVSVIADAFNSAKGPVRLKELFNLGVRTGRPQRTQQQIAGKLAAEDVTPEIVGEGFRDAILEFALTKAGGETAFNPDVFFKTLFAPMPGSKSKISLMDVASDSRFKIFDKQQASRLRFMAKSLANIQRSEQAGQLIDEALIQSSSGMRTLFAKMVGAIGGAAAYRAIPDIATPGSAASLVFGEAGSKYAQEILLDLPQSKRMDMLDEIFTDPDLVAILLTKPKNEKQAESQVNRVLKWFAGKGFGGAFRLQPEIIRETFAPGTDPVIDEALAPQEEPEPPAPTTTAVEPEIPTRPTAPAPTLDTTIAAAPPTGPTSQPVDQARFAAFFPNDPMSSLIRQRAASGGIGSLMG